MTEQSQVPNQQQDTYLQEHPDAVQNIELARSMALAGDQYETRAAKLRQEFVNELGSASLDAASPDRETYGPSLSAGEGRQPMQQKVDSVVDKINRENKSADKLYGHIAEANRRVQATKR